MTAHAPFTWEEIEAQVRKAVLCQLSILRQFGPNEPDLLKSFIGVDPDFLEESVTSDFPVERHAIHRTAKISYSYAYQTDDWHLATDEDFHEVSCGLLSTGYPQTDAEGEPSPLSEKNDFPLRRMFETFVARWKLSREEYTGGLTVRELALLSNMTIPAARTSLSKEGFKLEPSFRLGAGKDENNVLREEDAMTWLSHRRGFTPTRPNRLIQSSSTEGQAYPARWLEVMDFPQELSKAIKLQEKTLPILTAESGVPALWLQEITDGRPAKPDVMELRKLARSLRLPEADFTARAIQHLISAELTNAGTT